jgi:hypothetical protein
MATVTTLLVLLVAVEHIAFMVLDVSASLSLASTPSFTPPRGR